MSMNAFMHPRNIYRTKPDFHQLGAEFSVFKPFLKPSQSGKATIDFTNKDAVRELTKALLAKDFDLRVDIPENKLIPTLPLRLNYLLWIEDLLGWKKDSDPEQKIHGIDIGTGASCIYPLLAARTNGWKIIATETNSDSVKCAQKNVMNNNMDDMISVVHVEPSKILDGVLPQGESFDFCMCNPPFFSTEVETDSMAKARSPHREPPKNAFSGSTSELVVQGGELDFVKRIIDDSKKLKNAIRIYTTMVGHKKSANSILRELESSGATSISKTEFCQGNTTRWGIAWTFHSDIKLPSPKLQPVHNKKLQLPMEMVVSEDLKWIEYTVYRVTMKILEIFESLQATCKPLNPKSKKATYDVTAAQNTWSNQRKKRREQMALASTDEDGEPEAKRSKVATAEEPVQSSSGCEPALKFKMHVGIVENKVVIKLTWSSGSLGRDSLHQICQFIKNQFQKDLK